MHGATSVRILGPVEVWADDRRLGLGGRRQVALLALLVLNANRAMSADALIDALWGSNGSGATKRLQMTVMRLRRVLDQLGGDGAPRLQTVGAGYLFSMPSGGLDADLFDSLLAEGRAALVASEPARARELLGEALALWRGPPLAEVAFTDFAQAEIRRLEELRLAALETRIDADLRLGRHLQLIGELDALVAAEPTHERLASQLMVALYRSGRQADALEVFRRTRAHLAEQLGLEPGPALRALQAQILMQSEQLGAGLEPTHAVGSAAHTADSAAGHASRDRPRATRIPAPPTNTIGRDQEIAAVTRTLTGPASRLVTIVGSGGVGKTRLAAAVARAMEPELVDGAHWIELSGVARSDEVATAIARGLGVAALQGESAPDAVRRFLRGRSALLVVDNFEHVLDAATLIAELLASCPGLLVLATSREALDVRAEHQFVLAPLAVPRRPESATPAEIQTTDATALFAAAAHRRDNRFEVTDAGAPAIAQICCRVEGLPLALELAAARTGMFSVEDLAERLERSFDDLGTGPRDAPDRQRTIDATIEWSYGLLEPDLQDDFTGLSVFAGGATLDAAQAVTGASPDALAALSAKSLIDADDGPDGAVRLVMLESVRAYAAKRLAEGTRDEAVRRAHCRHYLGVVQREVARFSSRAELDALKAIDAEINNIRAGAQWALDAEPATALRLIGQLSDYWWYREDREALRWLDATIERAGDTAPVQDRARAQLARSMELTRHVQPPDRDLIAEAARAAQALYRQAGDHAGLSAALMAHGRCVGLYGQNDPSKDDGGEFGPRFRRALFEEACREAELAGDGVLLGRALARVANTLPADERRPMITRATELLTEGGDVRELANVYCNAGYYELIDGRAREAIALLEKGLAAAHAVEYGFLTAMIEGNLGLANLLLGDHLSAQPHFARELELSVGVEPFRVIAGEALTGLAAVCVAVGRAGEAPGLLGAARSLGFPEPSDDRVTDQLEADYFAVARSEIGDEAWRRAEEVGATLSPDEAIAHGIEQARVTARSAV